MKVDGRVATTNFKVFQQAHVTLDSWLPLDDSGSLEVCLQHCKDGLTVPPPDPEPKLWAMFKPRPESQTARRSSFSWRMLGMNVAGR